MEKDLCQFAVAQHSPTLKEFKLGAEGRDMEAEIESEIINKCCFLACPHGLVSLLIVPRTACSDVPLPIVRWALSYH